MSGAQTLSDNGIVLAMAGCSTSECREPALASVDPPAKARLWWQWTAGSRGSGSSWVLPAVTGLGHCAAKRTSCAGEEGWRRQGQTPGRRVLAASSATPCQNPGGNRHRDDHWTAEEGHAFPSLQIMGLAMFCWYHGSVSSILSMKGRAF